MWGARAPGGAGRRCPWGRALGRARHYQLVGRVYRAAPSRARQIAAPHLSKKKKYQLIYRGTSWECLLFQQLKLITRFRVWETGPRRATGRATGRASTDAQGAAGCAARCAPRRHQPLPGPVRPRGHAATRPRTALPSFILSPVPDAASTRALGPPLPKFHGASISWFYQLIITFQPSCLATNAIPMLIPPSLPRRTGLGDSGRTPRRRPSPSAATGRRRATLADRPGPARPRVDCNLQ